MLIIWRPKLLVMPPELGTNEYPASLHSTPIPTVSITPFEGVFIKAAVDNCNSHATSCSLSSP